MKSGWEVLSLCLLLLCLLLVAVGGCSTSKKALVIQGKVSALAGGAAIEGAWVVALDSNGSPVSTVDTSDGNGSFELTLAEDGENANLGSVTLRASADGYETFPSGLRLAIPMNTSNPTEEAGKLVVESALTNIGLITVPEGSGTASLRGTVKVPDESVGVLVVAETGSPATGFSAIADRDGDYRIFNLAAGTYSVKAYAQGVNYDAGTVELEDGEEADVDLSTNGNDPSTVSGTVQIVNAPGDAATSVILIVESTFDETLVRGANPPGLRAPAPGTDPNVTGTFTIEGVPEGSYVVLAAFEDDELVRDPDSCISGTDIVHQTVGSGETIEISEGFKITEALEVLGPGAADVETISTATPTFSWVDDSSEDAYHVKVLDTFGNTVWEIDIAGVSGSNPSVEYTGPALESGMFYQYRVVSSKTTSGTTCELSQTEDLKGIFILE